MAVSPEAAVLPREFFEAPLKKSPLRLLRRERQSALVGADGIRRTAEPSAKISPRRVSKVIVGQLTKSTPLVPKCSQNANRGYES